MSKVPHLLKGSALPDGEQWRLAEYASAHPKSALHRKGQHHDAAVLLLVLLGSWWGVRRRDRAAEQEAEAEHLLAGAGEPNALPRRWVTLFWSQRSSIAESRWAGMVESSLIIGSDAAQCDLCLPDRKVSPQHCVLAAQGDALLVQPLSDRAKVYVNGERIDGEHRLQNNDTLRIGKTTVRLVL